MAEAEFERRWLDLQTVSPTVCAPGILEEPFCPQTWIEIFPGTLTFSSFLPKSYDFMPFFSSRNPVVQSLGGAALSPGILFPKWSGRFEPEVTNS